MHKSSSSSAQARREARRDRVVALIASGWTQQDVARELEISQAQVSRDLHRRLADNAATDANAIHLRALYTFRRERLIRAYWDAAVSGQDLGAAQFVSAEIGKLERLNVPPLPETSDVNLSADMAIRDGSQPRVIIDWNDSCEDDDDDA